MAPPQTAPATSPYVLTVTCNSITDLLKVATKLAQDDKSVIITPAPSNLAGDPAKIVKEMEKNAAQVQPVVAPPVTASPVQSKQLPAPTAEDLETPPALGGKRRGRQPKADTASMQPAEVAQGVTIENSPEKGLTVTPVAAPVTDKPETPADNSGRIIEYAEVKAVTLAVHAGTTEGRKQATDLLAKYGVKNGTELKPHQWQAYVADAEKILAERAASVSALA